MNKRIKITDIPEDKNVEDLENFELTDYIEASDINGVNMTRGETVENVDGSYTLNVNVFDNLGNSTNINVIVNVN